MFDAIRQEIAKALEHLANGAHAEAQSVLKNIEARFAAEKAAAQTEALKIMSEAKAKADALLARFQ